MTQEELEDAYRMAMALRNDVEDACNKAIRLPDTDATISIRGRLSRLLDDIEDELQRTRREIQDVESSACLY